MSSDAEKKIVLLEQMALRQVRLLHSDYGEPTSYTWSRGAVSVQIGSTGLYWVDYTPSMTALIDQLRELGIEMIHS